MRTLGLREEKSENKGDWGGREVRERTGREKGGVSGKEFEKE